ncbi:hypothetical protein JCM30237_12460 [Halolamina litorea]|uniref:Uncharacterized protein n=1 Tax=Halolamina litorea TaxID=1515593 RepID=A0ABD6BN44_9EURY|nr:hypothetical protein [Halolamina litorea]
MAAIVQYVIALSSALTASMLVYIAREAHMARKTISDNEKRSMVNRAVLRREGMYVPIDDQPPTEGGS